MKLMNAGKKEVKREDKGKYNVGKKVFLRQMILNSKTSTRVKK